MFDIVLAQTYAIVVFAILFQWLTIGRVVKKAVAA